LAIQLLLAAGEQASATPHARGGLDTRVLVAIRTHLHEPALERAIAGLSRIGEHGGVWIAFGLAGGALDAPRRRCWRRATRAVLTTYLLNTALKLLVRRRRPQLEGLPALASAPTQLSFPSAHASTSFAGALAYSRLGAPHTPLYALASALALSRVYLGMHYPSDVLAGALFGSALGARLTAPQRAGCVRARGRR
jgi:membrane-associated phospholipid phosphatase